LNDLWKFDGNNWMWKSGSSYWNHVGNYGQLGIPDESNVPPSLSINGGLGWTDLNGNLWLYDGKGKSKDYSDIYEI
jgi:hypothetical protein